MRGKFLPEKKPLEHIDMESSYEGFVAMNLLCEDIFLIRPMVLGTKHFEFLVSKKNLLTSSVSFFLHACN